VLTAARADRTSFGCSNERAWTYFGDALFNRALRRTHDFAAAFEEAKRTVDGWERGQKFTPSEPQMAGGAALKPTLDEIAERLAKTVARAEAR
jgi:hypothetical protein